MNTIKIFRFLKNSNTHLKFIYISYKQIAILARRMIFSLRSYKHKLRLKLGLVKEEIHFYSHPDYNGTNLDKWINDGIKGYRQWYQPINFGNINAHVTTPPNWKPDPSLDYDYGLGRWNSIITRNLPEVANKRILDVGCNVGLYSIELAKMGASEVIGIDRNLDFNHKSNFPPKQDIISQARFVKKALELKSGTTYPVRYYGINFNDYEKLRALGRFDFILALNVTYHEYKDSTFFIKTLSEMTDQLVLQISVGHGYPLSKWANIPKHVEMLVNCDFTKIEIDCPVGYMNPMIIAKR